MRQPTRMTPLGLLASAILAACSSSPTTTTASVHSAPKPAPSAAGTGSKIAPAASSLATPTSPPPRAPEPAASLSGKPAGWPLPSDCEVQSCRLADGTPGVRCGASGACGNPCGAGRAPEKNGSYCSKRCQADGDCPGGKCAPEGVCDFWAKPLACDSYEFCDLPGGVMGGRCKPSDPCQSPCKKGLVLTGGTHCAKPCKVPADCPGGECSDGVCTPLCPAEGCPYLWE
ncbi:MAG: hypothetical protein IT373_16900 [Polyangiaceae bacterium]|nr:hypothetical protein [Polyangiaceae bacterium]